MGVLYFCLIVSQLQMLMQHLQAAGGSAASGKPVELGKAPGLKVKLLSTKLPIGPTLALFVTVEPTPLYEEHNAAFDANVMDPALEK